MKFEMEKPKSLQEKNVREQIKPGFYKEIGPNAIRYEKRLTIDGLEYYILLSKPKRLFMMGDWYLSFGAGDSEFVTNKGLGVYRQIIDAITETVKEVISSDKVSRINFFGSMESVQMTEIEELREKIKEKLAENKDALEGFHFHEEQQGSYVTDVSIKDGIFQINSEVKRHLSIIQKIKRVPEFYYDKRNVSVALLTEPQYLTLLLEDEKVYEAFCKYCGISYLSKSKKAIEKDVAKQRTDLYERTLKQRFPEYKFKRNGNMISLFI